MKKNGVIIGESAGSIFLQKEAKYRLGEIQYQMVESYHNHRGK